MSVATRFLDTNILLRYFTRDDEKKARQAFSALAKIERGEEKVAVSPLVIFEAVFTLQKHYQVSRDEIGELVSNVLSLHGLQLPNKSIFSEPLTFSLIRISPLQVLTMQPTYDHKGFPTSTVGTPTSRS